MRTWHIFTFAIVGTVVILWLVDDPNVWLLLDILAVLALLALLFAGAGGLGAIGRSLMERLDAVIVPEKKLSAETHLLIGLIFAAGAFFLQMALAQLIIVYSPLRPLFEQIGQVEPVLTKNVWWGIWGAFWAARIYYQGEIWVVIRKYRSGPTTTAQ